MSLRRAHAFRDFRCCGWSLSPILPLGHPRLLALQSGSSAIPTRRPWTHGPSCFPLFLLGLFQTRLRISSSGASWALPWPAGGPCSSPAPLTRASAVDQCLCSPQSQVLIHLEEDALMPKVLVLGGEAQGRGVGRRAGSPRWGTCRNRAPSTV